MNGNITGKIFESFKNRKFFDNSVLNKINTLTELGNQTINQGQNPGQVQGYESVAVNNIINVGNLYTFYIQIKKKIKILVKIFQII